MRPLINIQIEFLIFPPPNQKSSIGSKIVADSES